MSSTQIRSFSEITPEMIQDWKAKYGDRLSHVVVRRKLTDAEKQKDPTAKGAVQAQFVCRPPSRSVIDAIAKHQEAKNAELANKAVIANCVLGGDMDEMEQDGGVYTDVLDAVRNLMGEKEVEIKNI